MKKYIVIGVVLVTIVIAGSWFLGNHWFDRSEERMHEKYGLPRENVLSGGPKIHFEQREPELMPMLNDVVKLQKEIAYSRATVDSNEWYKAISLEASNAEDITNKICQDATAWCLWNVPRSSWSVLIPGYFKADATNIIGRHFSTNGSPGIAWSRVCVEAMNWYYMPSDQKHSVYDPYRRKNKDL